MDKTRRRAKVWTIRFSEIATMPLNNAALVFAPGNQWAKEKDAGPFFGLPAAWRRFVFQILSKGEFAVYCYICSVMDPNGIAYPAPEQIAADMGIRTRSVIVEAINTLKKRHFLLVGDEARVGRMGKRAVYQRPLPHYTIAKLLEDGLLDGDLFPTSNHARDVDLTRSSDDVVRASIRALIGDEPSRAYAALQDEQRRKRLLETALKEIVKQKVDSKEMELMKRRFTVGTLSSLAGLSDWMRDIIAEEQPNAPAAIKTPF